MNIITNIVYPALAILYALAALFIYYPTQQIGWLGNPFQNLPQRTTTRPKTTTTARSTTTSTLFTTTTATTPLATATTPSTTTSTRLLIAMTPSITTTTSSTTTTTPTTTVAPAPVGVCQVYDGFGNGCGVFSDGNSCTSGTSFASPNFPAVHDLLSLCIYSIEAPPGYNVKMHYDFFNLGDETSSSDSIVIYSNDPDESSPDREDGPSSSTPADFTSTTGNLLVYFQSTSTQRPAGYGFNATFTFVQAN